MSLLVEKVDFFCLFSFLFFFFTPITNSWLEMRHLICFLCKNSPFHSQLISSSSSLHSIASILTFIQSHRKALPPSSLLLPPLHPFPLPSVIPLLPFSFLSSLPLRMQRERFCPFYPATHVCVAQTSRAQTWWWNPDRKLREILMPWSDAAALTRQRNDKHAPTWKGLVWPSGGTESKQQGSVTGIRFGRQLPQGGQIRNGDSELTGTWRWNSKLERWEEIRSVGGCVIDTKIKWMRL